MCWRTRRCGTAAAATAPIALSGCRKRWRWPRRAACCSRLADDAGERWLLLGTHENRARARGGLKLAGLSGAEPVLRPERPNIFGLYEQNVGLVTPIIADRLVDALERYPEAWIAEAIGEAVGYNRRNWRYIQRILENWATEGRSDETNRGTATRTLDREKHLRGKYAAVFRRDD